ncbi:MAG TPA: heparinase II/III family protein, partial [Verrucomicrobium sp.]|nr:heparinase II/III family protein [Verrucomicrobium sp.]
SFDTLFMLLWAVPDQASPTVLARTYPEVPTYKYYPDHGVVHWRENWSDPDAVAFAFKAGPPAGHAFAKLLKEDPRWKPSLGHAQPDAGSFILFAGGSFLAGDTGYTGKKETADHNSLLVDGIGQHKGGTAWATFEGKSYDEYAKIAIKEVWLNSVVAVVTTDLTAAYDDALRLERVERKMMLVAGKYLLVADHLVSDVPHVYEWRWHSDRCAVIQGQNAEIRDRKVALVLNNLLSIDDMRVGATIVDTEVDANKAPRLQQRGYHISTKSKASPGHRFLTAGFVQRDAREKMKMAQRPDGVVTFSAATERCTLWYQPGAGLAGSYAFTVSDRSGRVTLAGFKGTSFDSGDAGFSVKVSKTASLLLRFDDDAVEIESTDKGDSVEVTLLQSGREKRAKVGAQPVRLVLE